MTIKENLLNFLNTQFNDTMFLATRETLLEANLSNTRTWVATKERLIELITTRFDDNLVGVLDQEIAFQIHSWFVEPSHKGYSWQVIGEVAQTAPPNDGTIFDGAYCVTLNQKIIRNTEGKNVLYKCLPV